MDQFHNIIGIVGSALIIVAYFLLQIERLSADRVEYSLMNLFGAAGIVFSLYFDFNWSAFVVEAFWIAISIIGVVKALTHSRRRDNQLKG